MIAAVIVNIFTAIPAISNLFSILFKAAAKAPGTNLKGTNLAANIPASNPIIIPLVIPNIVWALVISL